MKGFLAVLTLGVLALVPRANATVEIVLSDGGVDPTLTVLDGSALDSCAAVNCVTFNGTYGSWSINVSTGTATFGLNPSIDLNTVNSTTTNNAPTLTVLTSANGYTPAAIDEEYSGGGSVNKAGTYTFQAFGGNSNILGDTSNALSPLESFTAPSLSTSKKNLAFAFDDGPTTITTPNVYSLTVVSTLVFKSGFTGSASSNTVLTTTPTTVPEPAVVTLLGGVLLFTVSAIRRKSRRA